MASEKITALIEEVKGLTVLELSELVHALEDEFGVSAAAMAAPAAGAGAAAPAAEEKTEFDVVLASFDAAAKIKVIKAVREITGLGDLSDSLNGTTSLAISHEDPIAPMRVINKFAKQFNGAKFVIKAGFMDGKILPLDEINAMAELPSKEVLQAQVLGTMLAPITSLAIVLKAIAEEKGGFVEAAAEPEAAPAE